MKKHTKFTPEQLEFIKNNQHFTRKKLTIDLNEKFGTAFNWRSVEYICRCNNWQTGRERLFGAKKNGEDWRPWNAGLAGKGVCKANKTSFAKGMESKRRKPIGYVRTNYDGFTVIKVGQPDSYRLKHHLLWEEHHKQKIPDGHIVRFLDGDRSNFEIDNLVLITRSEHRLLNNVYQIDKYDPSLRPVILMIAKIQCRIKKLTKDLKG